MAIDKALYSDTPQPPPIDAESIDVAVPPESTISEEEDGSVVVDFGSGDAAADMADVAHGANLVDHLEDGDLSAIGAELISLVEADKNSRKQWETTYVKGLEHMGLKIEERTEPWKGACGVFHPVMTESIIRFQSNAVGEIFPAAGPVRTKVVGPSDIEKDKQAKRVEDDMNHQIVDVMTDYRPETERMLFNLPLAGSAFKKVFYDPMRGRPVSMFVPADELIVSYGTSDLETSTRFAHMMMVSDVDLLKQQETGFYRSDIVVPPTIPEVSNIEQKTGRITGEEPTIAYDDRHCLYEVHVDYDLPEPFNDPSSIPRPHVITVHKNGTVMAIRRNWKEDDSGKNKKMHFVHYCYIPGLGFYGIGLIHLIGGLAKGATSILRQLVDAGQLANLPGGFKLRGLRIKGDDTPIEPGEWRDVDIAGDKVKDALMPLPYGEPSTVLYQLMGNLVDEARRLGSTADTDLANLSGGGANAPVGTTLAILERSLKIMSAVQARLHSAQMREFKLVATILKERMPGPYDTDPEGENRRDKDYDDRVDVIPVSDPNASTMAQRVVQHQAALQLAAQAPDIYDQKLLHRGMLDALQIPNRERIVPLPEEMTPQDPVVENMAIIKQEPVRAYLYQDHNAHIQVHMAAIKDPKLAEHIGQSPNAQAISQAGIAHVTEHVAFQYRAELEKRLGVPLPDPDTALPKEVEYELSGLVVAAAEKLLQENTQDKAKAAAKEQLEDPLTQIQLRDQDLKEKKQKEDHEIKLAEVDIAQDEVALKAAELLSNKDAKDADRTSKEAIEGIKAGMSVVGKVRKGRDDGSTRGPTGRT